MENTTKVLISESIDGLAFLNFMAKIQFLLHEKINEPSKNHNMKMMVNGEFEEINEFGVIYKGAGGKMATGIIAFNQVEQLDSFYIPIKMNCVITVTLEISDIDWGYKLKDYEYEKGCDDFLLKFNCIDKDNDIEYSELVVATRKIAISHKKYIQSEEWNIKRKAKLKDAGYKCQLCSANETELHVHHNNYENLGNEEMTDLIVLCKECHSKFHDKLEIIEENN